MDWGLFALFTVLLTLVFLAFHAWRGVKAEYDRIDAHRRGLDAKFLELQAEVQRSRDASEEARRIAGQVEGTHFKTLLRRIDEAEASALGAVKQCEVLAAKQASLGGRLSALARWTKKEEPEEEEDLPFNQVNMFPAHAPAPEAPQPQQGVGRQFGRKVV